MRYLYILIIFCLFADHLNAQYYRTLLTDGTAIYNGAEVVPVAVDSFEVDGADTIFYFYRHVRPKAGLPNNCTLDTEGAAWTGTKMIRRADHEIFFNKNGDSIIFYVHNTMDYARIDTIYKFSDGRVVTMQQDGEVMETVLGENDYSKHFILKVLNTSGNETNHPLNNFKIISSNRFGFIKAPDFYNFPDNNSSYYLTGRVDPPAGKVNVKLDSIFNIEKGYEFHYNIYNSSCGFAGCRTESIKEKRFVIDKGVSPNADTLLFTYQRSYINEISDPVIGNYTEMGVDTISERITLSEWRFLDSLNREPFIWANPTWNDPAGYAVESAPDSTGPRYRKELFLGYDHDAINNCLAPRTGTFPKFIFGDGLGITYSYIDSGGVDQFERNLVYYQRGIEQWGIPLDLSAITGVDNIDMASVKVYPNPVRDQLFIEGNEWSGFEVTIFDMAGRSLISKKISASASLDVSILSRGIYIVSISGKKDTRTFKVVKR